MINYNNLFDEEIFNDIDAYLSSADPMLLKDIAKITEIAKRTDCPNPPFDGSIKKRKYWKKVTEK